MKYHFRKMNGLGNEFVIFDQREINFDLTPERIQTIAHRRFGIGCDQLIILENPRNSSADVFMRIFNADGQDVGACGNATRCLGSLLSEEFKRNTIIIETVASESPGPLTDNPVITLPPTPQSPNSTVIRPYSGTGSITEPITRYIPPTASGEPG